MIEVRDLHKSYRRARGLAGFSMAVEKGEVVGLVGPNGAGKTTLIKTVATLLRADSGTVRVGDWDVAENPTMVRRMTGYLPDVAGIYQDLRIGEFLDFFAAAFHVKPSSRRAAVERALDTAGLTDRADEYVEHLSLGWKQRLQLAKTLIHEPQVLLLDEPASGLDPLARIAFRDQLKQLRAAGITILVSSHILADLADVCTRIVFISDGKEVVEHAEADSGDATVGERKFRCLIEFRENAAAGEIAKKSAGVRIVETAANRIMAEIDGDERNASLLLRALLDSGVVITHFETKNNDLEARYVRTFRRASEKAPS